MAKGAIKIVRETVVREAVPAAKAMVTVVKRHGSRMFQDWTKEYGKERKKVTRNIGDPKNDGDQKSL
ncbi:hypothetical protein [Rubrobacter indicoceani]|uniref:hypothetical protein n=1 Tax=Rubrobacter indicoceani TaxID=2051957 RepID=UPI000E5BEFE6|nr:hypothetical protein [Rubrobacter indicoceani]